MKPHEFPENSFDTGNISVSEITIQLKRSRKGSATCPYEQIIDISTCGWSLNEHFNHCLYRWSVPAFWKAAVVILLGKPAAKNDARNPSDFRPIAPTPCID